MRCCAIMFLTFAASSTAGPLNYFGGNASHRDIAVKAISYDNSLIVGSFVPSNLSKGGRVASTWSIADGFSILPPTRWGTGTLDCRWSAVDIAADGRILGYDLVLCGPLEAAVWSDYEAPPVQVPDLNGVSINAQAISMDGEVIVGASSRPEGNAAVRSIGMGEPTYLFPVSNTYPQPLNDSIAVATNADGSVIVGDRLDRAFVWTESEPGRYLAPEPSQANDITADGQWIVGSASGPGVPTSAFLWHFDGTSTLLDRVNWRGSIATSISDDGSVVVGSTYWLGGRITTFVWTPEHGMRRLIDLLVRDGHNPFAAVIYADPIVSADGTIIAGRALPVWDSPYGHSGFRFELPDLDFCSYADMAAPYGIHDFFDVSRFLTEFTLGGVLADSNFDGAVDFFDLSNFLTEYNAGCN
jgi:uncharacterized membrane protein